jgi:hypothetical protein
VADEELSFHIEEIPDADSVFMRAHRDYISDGELRPRVFRAQDGSMSVDWDKYSTPEATRQRAKKNPENNAVIRMGVGGIRGIGNLDVKHSPELDNQAHSDVNLPDNGADLTELRVLLRRIAQIVLPLSA